MDSRSRYIRSDIMAVKIARVYSNEAGAPFRVMVGDFGDYDISSDALDVRIEIKYESTPTRTGNVAIEYWNTDLGSPSGVLGTKANRWLHVVPEGEKIVGYELDTDNLKRIVIEHREVKSNGRNSLCAIVPLSVVRSNATRVLDLTEILKDVVP